MRTQLKPINPIYNLDDWIDPVTFVERMDQHWTGNEIKNVSSEALRKTWRQIASAFKAHIIDHHKPEGMKRWNILSPPTGSGKTEGTIIYCSMLADLPECDHPGVLIVTRLIEDCKRIAERINKLGSQDTAIAYHSQQSDVKLTDLCEYPVVVITHKAYELALDFLGHEGRLEMTWPYFHNWMIDTRKLVIIDEALDIVDHFDAGLNGLRQTLAAIPQHIRNGYSRDVKAVETVIGSLEVIDRKSKGTTPKETMLFKKQIEHGTVPDLQGLIESLKGIRFDLQIGKIDQKENERLRQKHEKRLKNLHYIFRSWCYYASKGLDHTFNTARLLIPDEESVKGAVVLDATASTNVVYELHKDSHRLEPPKGSRDYSNFTLHISRGHRVGKNYMKDNAKQLCSDLVYDLNQRLKDRRVFIICHKDVEPILSKFDTSFEMITGHWGTIDGSNQWRDCDTVVVFGFPYLPDTWSANVFFAIQGPRDTEWLRSEGDRPYGDHTDIRKALKRGQLSTSIIQAINRIRVRKVINDQGHCPNSEGFILLPKGDLADAVLKDIHSMMPGINIIDDWRYSKQKKRVKASNHERAFIKYVENLRTGKYYPMQIKKDLGMSPRTYERLTAKAKKPGSDLKTAMDKAQVRYIVERHGKTTRAYFRKD